MQHGITALAVTLVDCVSVQPEEFVTAAVIVYEWPPIVGATAEFHV
jgi:hypothetical protein